MIAPALPPSQLPVASSRWWLERLTRTLFARQRRFELLDAYYRGTQSLANLASAAWMESELAAMFPSYLSANHAKLIVNAAAQRLVVLGFRIGDDAPNADDEAARIWRANDMDAESDKAHTESLVKGECPVLVEPNPKDPTTPVITAQDPSKVIVWHAAGDRRIRLAGLKTWWDDEARRRFYILYLPDRIENWQDREPSQMDRWMNALFSSSPERWEPRERRDQPAVVRNPLGEVPIVVLPNDPRLSGSPEAEHEPVLSRIDHYNKTLMDMAVTSHELAYPQRYGIGVEVDEGEVAVVDGVEVRPTRTAGQTGQTRWITTPSPDASFGQFAAATLDQYVKKLDQIRADIATDTFTPYHFLLNMPSSVPPSGESITAAESALVDKVRGHGRDKGAGWRTAMRLAFLVAGDTARADAMRTSGHVIWSDPERRTESQHIDALSKLGAAPIGLPQEALWEMIPATPADIKRWRRMLADRTATTPGAIPSREGQPESSGLTTYVQGGT